MKSIALGTLFVTMTALFCCAHVVAEEEIQSGKHISSADGCFTAQLTDDREGNIQIKSNRMGKVFKVGALRPLYFMKWTGDSQTLVTIEHVAGGSQAVLIHYDGDKWSRFEVDPTGPPPPYHHYAVIRQEIEWETVKLTYKVTDEKSNGIVTKFYLCSFDADPRTRSITNMQKHEIGGNVYRALQLQVVNKK